MKSINNKVIRAIMLDKSRSTRANLSLTNFIILGNTWIFCRSLLPSALLMGIVVTLTALTTRFLTGNAALAVWLGCALVTLYFYSTFIYGFARLMKHHLDTETSLVSPLRGWQEYRSLFPGSLPLFYFNVIIFALSLLFVIGGTMLLRVSPYLLIPVLLLALLLCVPFALSQLNMVADDTASIGSSLKFGFTKCLRHFGSTLLILFIATIIFIVLGIIGSLPTLILQWAIAASDASVAVGDPTDLPPYVHGLSFFFIIFATAFATLSTLYGWIAGFLHIHSVFAKERDRLNRQDKR